MVCSTKQRPLHERLQSIDFVLLLLENSESGSISVRFHDFDHVQMTLRNKYHSNGVCLNALCAGARYHLSSQVYALVRTPESC